MKKTTHNWFVFLLVTLLAAAFGVNSARGATNQSPTLAFADVSATIANSVAGDTVLLPPGTGVWTAPLVLNGISLVGSGTNQTIIVDNMDRNNAYPSQSLLSFQAGTTKTVEIAHFQLTAGNQTRNWRGEITIGNHGPTRLHHVYFNRCNDKILLLAGANLTLVDHCYFDLTYAGIVVHDLGYGDISWAAPANYGTELMPVIEDCYFTNEIPTSTSNAAMDCEFGGRVTFRHNQLFSTFFEAHGTETGFRQRGGRLFEVYSNTFYYDPALWFPCAVNLRAGSGVFYGNVCTGVRSFGNINVNRATERFAPWGGADGFNSWDDNAGTNYLTGVHAGSSGSKFLQVAGASWAVNQWYGYTAVNLNWNKNHSAGGGSPVEPNGQTNFNYSVIYSNNANQIFYLESRSHGWMYFTNGDHFVITKVNHVLDQPGLGSGDLIQGDGPPWGDYKNVATGTVSWPHEVLEGIYSWNNVNNGGNPGFSSGYPHCQPGHEIFNDTPKPGYQPLTYPHPLQGVSGGSGGGSTSLQPPQRIWIQ
jgi:hypothetical protein